MGNVTLAKQLMELSVMASWSHFCSSLLYLLFCTFFERKMTHKGQFIGTVISNQRFAGHCLRVVSMA